MAALQPAAFPAKSRGWLPSLGLATILCGQPLGWSIRGLLLGPTSESALFPALPVLIGLALLFNPEWIVRRRLECSPAALALPIFGLLLPFLALSVLAPPDIRFSVGAYTAVLIVLAIVLAMTPAADLTRLPPAVLLVGFLSSATPLIELGIAGPSKHFLRLTVGSNDNPLIIGSIAGMTVLAGLMVGVGKGGGGIWRGLMAGLASTVGLLSLMLTNTRSAAGMVVVCVLAYLFLLRRLETGTSGSSAGRRIWAFGGLLAASASAAPLLAIALLGPDLFWDLVKVGGMRFAGAFAVVDQAAGSVDLSTAIRGQLLREVWETLTLSGHGYMSQALASGDSALYPHLSYAQAFYDLGIIGGTVFLFIALVLPAGICLAAIRRGALHPASVFSILMLIFVQGDHLAHGTPYSWTSLVPTVMVFTLIGRRELATSVLRRVSLTLTGRKAKEPDVCGSGPA